MNMGFIEFLLDFMTPSIVWGLFAVILVAFIIISAALAYHWREYSMRTKRGGEMIRLYILISSILLLIMFVSAVTYSVI